MKLLIIEDNIEISNDLGAFFAENGFVVESALSLQIVQQNICDLNQLSIHYQYDNGQHTFTLSKPKV